MAVYSAKTQGLYNMCHPASTEAPDSGAYYLYAWVFSSFVHPAPIYLITQTHGVFYHCYADDTQLYLSFQPDDPTVAVRISSCLANISTWMKEHHLELNLAKTELLILSAIPSLQHDFTIQLDSSSFTPSRSVRNLSVIFDDQLTCTDHIQRQLDHAGLHNIRTQLLVQQSRPWSFLGLITAMLFWLDFHHVKLNLYK